jgi:hypothetical protein
MGQFRPLSDVPHSETTPPVVEAFTMSVATVDALDATQCTLEHSFGVSPQRPRNRRARRANVVADTHYLFGEKSQLKLP